ncbi:serine/threonine-protein kinase toxin HipA [Ditylenchus destructor]|nr:serine/threonine-protein kinase toxin HipA [Ditylenchus destructor]
MNGERVGTWGLTPQAPDTLQYDPSWIESRQGRPLSLSLPFAPGNAPHRGEKVHTYFENLLPDSKDIRERLARRFQTGSTDAFELLAEIGRDCVGALEILPEGQVSPGITATHAEPLSDADVAQVLRSATTPQTLGRGDDDDEFRISIAGAQEKTALLRLDGKWCLPRGGTPTTHIFKLPLGLIGGMKLDMRHSVENEWAVRADPEGLRPARGRLRTHALRGHQSPGGRALRPPLVDFSCRGQPPHPPPAGGHVPSHGRRPRREVRSGRRPRHRSHPRPARRLHHPRARRRDFFTTQLLFWMLCATDGHAKNFSLFLRPGGGYQLTPLYDVLSAYPVLGTGPASISPHKVKLAMPCAPGMRTGRCATSSVAIGSRWGLAMACSPRMAAPSTP